jgi:hypothetical protein
MPRSIFSWEKTGNSKQNPTTILCMAVLSHQVAKITMIGHCTVLIEAGGRRILTDPYSDYMEIRRTSGCTRPR